MVPMHLSQKEMDAWRGARLALGISSRNLQGVSASSGQIRSLLSVVWRIGSGRFVSSAEPTKEQAMTHHVTSMLETYPKDLGGVDEEVKPREVV